MREEFIFESLEVYKRALGLSIFVSKICSDFPVQYSRIRDQFVGAIISIPLNIAEGSGRKTDKDKSNFYKIARSSSFECVPIIDICFELKLIDVKTSQKIRQEISELSKMLSGLNRRYSK